MASQPRVPLNTTGTAFASSRTTVSDGFPSASIALASSQAAASSSAAVNISSNAADAPSAAPSQQLAAMARSPSSASATARSECSSTSSHPSVSGSSSSSTASSHSSSPYSTTSVSSLSPDHLHHNELYGNISLQIIQQPMQCRLSSGNYKEKRSIDPPPVVKLINADEIDPELPFLVLHASLWSIDLQTEMTLSGFRSTSDGTQVDGDEGSAALSDGPSSSVTNDVPDHEPSDTLRPILLGSYFQTGVWVNDEHDERCFLFIFNDLRMHIAEGRFRLRFTLFSLGEDIADDIVDDEEDGMMFAPYENMTFSTMDGAHTRPITDGIASSSRGTILEDGSSSGSTTANSSQRGQLRQAIAQVDSEIFQAYPARKFPGTTPVTALSRALSKQGIRMLVRENLKAIAARQAAAQNETSVTDALPPPIATANLPPPAVATTIPPSASVASAVAVQGRPASQRGGRGRGKQKK